MKPLLRRYRRNKSKGSGLGLRAPRRNKQPQHKLIVEPLENRLLLTTVTLPKGATEPTQFWYADPQGGQDETGPMNVLTIGTLSGLAPEQDIVVEILNYRGEDVPGRLVADGQEFDIAGGIGGAGVIAPVPSDLEVGAFGPLNASINALATNSAGTTYGITEQGWLVEIDTTRGEIDQLIAQVIDTDAIGVGEVTLTNFDGADFGDDGKFYVLAEGPTQIEPGGEITATGEVLITVDINTGEAEAVGRNASGQPDYEFSAIDATDAGSIVYSRMGDSGEMIFLVSDTEDGELLEVAPTPTLANPAFTPVLTNPVLAEAGALTGLMYDSTDRLWAVDNGDLLFVDLAAGQVVVAASAEATLGSLAFDTVEAVGYATDPDTNTLYRVDTARLQPGGDDGFVIVGGPSDIYLMVIEASTADTYVTLTYHDGEQFQAAAGDSAFLFDDNGSEIFTPGAAGGVMIGTAPQGDPNSDDVRWAASTFLDATETMALPYQGYYRPGIVLAPDDYGFSQEIGKIQIGGGVFGDVIINGSIGAFYAGFLGTNEFNVHGEMQGLVVGTEAGGRNGAEEDWWAADDAILNVDGQLGSFYSNGDWGLPVRVAGQGDAPEFPGVLNTLTGTYYDAQREFEFLGNPDPDSPEFQFAGLDTTISNDSFATAQYIGAVNGDTIRLLGYGEGFWNPADALDYFSFGAYAGETVRIQVFDTFASSDISLPNGHPVQPNSSFAAEGAAGGLTLYGPSDETNALGMWGEREISTGMLLDLQYDIEEAGIYTIELAITGGYRIEIEGLTQTTLGGATVGGNMRHDVTDNPDNINIEVMAGNMGALNVEGVARSTQLRVNQGSLAAVRAAHGQGDEGFGFALDSAGNPVITPEPFISTAGRIGSVSSPVSSVVNFTAGGNLQSLRMGSDFTGMIVSKSNIGEIAITGAYLGGAIFANADGIGKPGIIDHLYVGGDLELDLPISVGARGGNVRFVEIGGTFAIRIGGWTDIGGYGPFEFNPGQAVTIIDDSGAQVRIAPGYMPDQIDEFLFGPQTPTDEDDTDDPDQQDDEGDEDDEDQVTLEGGALTLQLLPICDLAYEDYLLGTAVNRSLLGFAIASIESTDGLRVSSTGGPVDLGVVTVAGDQDDRVSFQGSQAVSVLQLDISGAISTVTNNSGHWETYDTNANRWVKGKGAISRWNGGDIVSMLVAADAGVQPDEEDGQTTQDGDGDDPETPTAPEFLDDATRRVFPFDLINIKGNLGFTEAITGQRIQQTQGLPEAPGDTTIFGETLTAGLISATDIGRIIVAGSLDNASVQGDVGRITINSDGIEQPGQFDGVAGPIYVSGDLIQLHPGHGVHDPGTGDFPASGVFVGGTLISAEFSGPGNDLAGPLLASEIERVRILNGAQIIGYNGEGGNAERARGVLYMAHSIAATTDFADWQFGDDLRIATGEIGLIEVRGQGSAIHGASISAVSIESIRVLAGAEGMFDSRVIVFGFDLDTGYIHEVRVGGQGIHDTVFTAGRTIDRILVTRGGTIEDSQIHSGYQIGLVQADQINRTDIDAPSNIDRVIAKDDIFDLVIEAGAVRLVRSGGDILGSAIIAGGPLNMVNARGDLISTIEVTGPYGHLGSLRAGGDIGTPTGGQILVDGRVGMIRAGGDFLAHLNLNWTDVPVSAGNPQGGFVTYQLDGLELGRLMAGGVIAGLADIGGDVGMIRSGGDFGIQNEQFNVHGQLRRLQIGSGRTPADLQASMYVADQLGTVRVFGNVNGDINVENDFNSLMLRGSGDDRADLNGDIVVGGAFGKLTIINGDIAPGVLLDVAQDGPSIVIRGSDIAGAVFAGGGATMDIDGSILDQGRYVVQGDAGTLHIKGNIEPAGVLEIEGDVEKLIVDGTIYGTVHVTGSVGTLQAYNITGNDAIVTVGQNIDRLNIAGQIKDSYVLAGFDAGDVVDDDGNVLLNRTQQVLTGQATTGSIDLASVGTLYRSVVAAGVSPGDNTVFGDFDGSDLPGQGQSTIGKMTIRQVLGDGSPFGVFADSGVQRLKVAGRRLATPTLLSNGFRSFAIEEPTLPALGGFYIEQGLPFHGVIDGKHVSVILTGPGWAEVLPVGDQIEAIQLHDTSDRTRLRVSAAGADTIDVGQLYTGDDESLRLLQVDGLIANDEHDAYLHVGGDVAQLRILGLGAGADLTIEGAVDRADLGNVNGTLAQPTNVQLAGPVQLMRLGQVSADTTIAAAQINRLQGRGNMAGTIQTLQGSLQNAVIQGDLTGAISSALNIDRLIIKGQLGQPARLTTQGVRAAHDIGLLRADSMTLAVAAAGGDLIKAQIAGDVSYSTLASGLDIGEEGILNNGNDLAQLGDVKSVIIAGDLIESNVVAALAAGPDAQFGTADDTVAAQGLNAQNAPRIADVLFDASQPDRITVLFEQANNLANGDVESLVVRDEIQGSDLPGENYAIAAAGRVLHVMANRQVFAGDDNVQRLEVRNTSVLGSALEVDDVTPANANTLPFQVLADGLDLEFGTLDDYQVTGNADTADQPTVYIKWNSQNNSLCFVNEDGFITNPRGTNYYQIRLDASQITSYLGTNLDGDFEGDWPTGDGTPGGDFIYYFAVADMGDTVATAFSPFPDTFPENVTWQFLAQTGDNMNYSGSDALRDEDYVRLNGLQQGQVIVVSASDSTQYIEGFWNWEVVTSEYGLGLYRIVENNLVGNDFSVIEYGGRNDITPDDALLVPADLVIPGLDQITYTAGQFYAYEDLGGTFYTLDPTTYEPTLLDNNLDDINNLVAEDGVFTSLQALAGHSDDSLWAIGQFNPNDGQPRQSLVLLKKLSQDINNVDPDERIELVYSTFDLASAYADLVGLAELNGVLYGIDTASNTLIQFDADPLSDTFGQPTPVAGLNRDDLTIVGLAPNADGESLLLLHDRPIDDTQNLPDDGLYNLNATNGQVSLLKTFSFDQERHGLAVEPDGTIIVGLPLRSSPVGDQVRITITGDQDLGTINHTFGQDTSVFSSQYQVASDSNSVFPNAQLTEFIQAGFHYAFDIDYASGPAYGDLTVTIEGIDWNNPTEFGQIFSVASDDPANVDVVLLDTDTIQITIEADSGDGDVRVFFAGTSDIEAYEATDVVLAGAVSGGRRNDLDPQRPLLLPDLDEITMSATVLDSLNYVELSDNLQNVLSDDLQDQLDQEGLSNQWVNDVLDEIYALDPLVYDINGLIEDLFSTLNSTIEYDALGYDSQQEIFALVSSNTRDASPLYVNDPDNIDTDPDNDIPLTRDVLSDILAYQYQLAGADELIQIDAIDALDFGPLDQTTNIEPLYAIATFTVTDTVTDEALTYDGLLLINDIRDPYAGMVVAEPGGLTVQIDALTYDLDITSLANAAVPAADSSTGALFGIDAITQTLVSLDVRTHIRDILGNLRPNVLFGTATPLGAEIANLGNPGDSSFQVTAIDMDSTGRLFGIDQATNALVRLNTAVVPAPGQERIETYLPLPDADWRDITFDVTETWERNLDTGDTFNFGLAGQFNAPAALLVRGVTAEPFGDTVRIRLDDSEWANHTFGTILDTTIGNVTVSSSTANDAQSVTDAGAYYRFDIQYATGQGQIELTIDDIDWPAGSTGDIDAVILSDSDYVTIETFNSESLTLAINTNAGQGDLTIFFGATADLFEPASGQLTAELVQAALAENTTELVVEIPQDGDYVLQIAGGDAMLSSILDDFGFTPGWWWTYFFSGGPLTTYDLDVNIFNDGNSDFGLSQTDSGFDYDQFFPNNDPVNLEPLSLGNDDLVPYGNTTDHYRYNPDNPDAPADDPRLDWPVQSIAGTLLDPGNASNVTIDTELANLYDVDVYQFRLAQGQFITVDLDAEVLFGRDDVDLQVGIYNGDLESLTAVYTDADDTLPAPQFADDTYAAQAVFAITGHDEIIDPDPDGDGYATYYVVVTAIPTDNDLSEHIPYRLIINTTDPQTIQTNDSPQVVWLAFGDVETNTNATADYLYGAFAGGGANEDIVNRPAFDAEAFGLADMRQELIEEIAQRIEQVYRDAGLTEDEIVFTLDEPPRGSEYSTVIFGGTLPDDLNQGVLLGLAEAVDRHNANRTDQAVVLSDTIALVNSDTGFFTDEPLDNDPLVRFDQAATLLSNTGAHELGHILGLEHCTEINTPEPNNLMGYNEDLVPQVFEQRCSFRDFSNDNYGGLLRQIGFQNEIDMLLRNLALAPEPFNNLT